MQNKTGLVLFSFHNGLAEKHRILTNLTHNVTLGSRTYSYGPGFHTPVPTRTLTASLQTGPLSASIVDYAVGITDLGDKAFKLAEEAYSAITPCVSISAEYVRNSTSSVGSLVQYLVGVNNCSAHPELMLISGQVPQGIPNPILETERFDSEAHSIKKLNMTVMIPVNYLQYYQSRLMERFFSISLVHSMSCRKPQETLPLLY